MVRYIRVDLRLIVLFLVITLIWNYFVFFHLKTGSTKSDKNVVSMPSAARDLHPSEFSTKKESRRTSKSSINNCEFPSEIGKDTRVLLPFVPGGDFLWQIFNAENFTKGAEIGVAGGGFAQVTLENWKHCKKYYLIDPWVRQTEVAYFDKFGNANQVEQDKRFNDIKNLIKPYPCGEIMRTFSDKAAALIEDGSLDWVYIDARHDYKSVLEDLVLWYPKVRVGGVISGHDYLDREGKFNKMENEWAVMNNGMLHKDGKSVKGAVDRFIQEVDAQVLLAGITPAVVCKSWYFRKLRNVKVDIETFEEDFKGIEPTDENLKLIGTYRYHQWLPAWDELYVWYNSPRKLNYDELPHAHPLGGKCKKVFQVYNEQCPYHS